MLGAERLVVGGAAAVREPAHDDLVAADDLLAIDPQVLPVVQRPARRREAPGDQRRDVVRPAGLDRPVGKVDGGAFDARPPGTARCGRSSAPCSGSLSGAAASATLRRRCAAAAAPAARRAAGRAPSAPRGCRGRSRPRRAPRCRTDSRARECRASSRCVNRSAGPRFASTRREISVISSAGLTGVSIVFSSPRLSRWARNSRRSLNDALRFRARWSPRSLASWFFGLRYVLSAALAATFAPHRPARALR